MPGGRRHPGVRVTAGSGAARPRGLSAEDLAAAWESGASARPLPVTALAELGLIMGPPVRAVVRSAREPFASPARVAARAGPGAPAA